MVSLPPPSKMSCACKCKPRSQLRRTVFKNGKVGSWYTTVKGRKVYCRNKQGCVGVCKAGKSRPVRKGMMKKHMLRKKYEMAMIANVVEASMKRSAVAASKERKRIKKRGRGRLPTAERLARALRKLA